MAAEAIGPFLARDRTPRLLPSQPGRKRAPGTEELGKRRAERAKQALLMSTDKLGR